NIKLFEGAKPTLRVWLKKNIVFLRLLIIIVLIIALARPQAGRKEIEITSYGIDIILAIDTSMSMTALDMDLKNKKTRVDITKEVIKEFIKKREGDRIGMVVFGQYAYTQCPLTTDYQIYDLIIENIKPGMAGPATNISMAIISSLNRLKSKMSKTQIIILLTDGKQTVDDIPISQAVSLAKTLGIKIYTIGIGRLELAPALIPHPQTGQLIYQQINSEFDFETLKYIAAETGGKFYKAEYKNELKNVYDDINKLEKTKVKVKKYMNYTELFIYFLYIAFALIIFEFLLNKTIFSSLP
ncbi:MAG TPA: VWA domain-containing protein, partial [bacterium]|nr:VWA domain-containing protein [bacterium]